MKIHATAEVVGSLRGTVADAVDHALECSRDRGCRVIARVDRRRVDLPPIWEQRVDHDGPTWDIPRKAAHGTTGSAGDEH